MPTRTRHTVHRLRKPIGATRRHVVLIALCAVVTVAASFHPLAANARTPVPRRQADPTASGVVRFQVGEQFDYDVRFGRWKVGRGSMHLVGIDTVRGVPVWHAVLAIRGKVSFFSVNDTLESWFDMQTLSSHRFRQYLEEGSRERVKLVEMFPGRGMFREDDQPERVGVRDPLDETSFLYYVRSIPRPTFKSKGLFGEGGKAEVWLTDDSSRAMVQLKTSLPVGSISLQLTGWTK